MPDGYQYKQRINNIVVQMDEGTCVLRSILAQSSTNDLYQDADQSDISTQLAALEVAVAAAMAASVLLNKFAAVGDRT